MKSVMVLDEAGSKLVSDPLNQRIIVELVTSEASVTEPSHKLGIPVVKLWRRVKKLVSAKILDESRFIQVGNLRKRFYRASALLFVPRTLMDFQPKNEMLREAIRTYSEIQMSLLRETSAFNDIPEAVNPIDFSVYINLLSFCKVYMNPSTSAKIVKLNEQISHMAEFGEILKHQ